MEPQAAPLTAEDIEAAYERALQAMNAVEVAVESLDAAVAEDVSGTEPQATPADADGAQPPSPAEVVDGESGDVAHVFDEVSAPALHPREVIEAALFVGGQPLTTKRLSQMLGGNETPERIDGYVDDLNTRYRDELRPYEIDFGEGGYRLVLTEEYEPVRSSVFGAGPKEVKLSQEALETLAFVAYRQPATREDLEDTGKESAASLLRQLLRRGLISLNRDADDTVTYSTTDRFLDVFGLRSLDDLPFPEDLEMK